MRSRDVGLASRRSRIRFLAPLVCAIALGGFVSPASAQPAPRPPDGLRVPGGVPALLAAAGLDSSRPRATALLDVVRVIHEVREGVDASTDERRARLFQYLGALAEFERASAPFQAGTIRLASAQNKSSRKTIEAFAKAIGSSLEEENRTYRLRPSSDPRDQKRREWLLSAGFDAARFEAAMNGGASVRLMLSGDEVPLPLPLSLWRLLLEAAQKDDPLLVSILTDRAASLLYYGLFSMDDETRLYFATKPDLVREVYGSDRVGVMALCGRSLRVHGARIEAPGGAAATALWEAVAGERVTRPDRFILKVLARDRGRLALLYDVVAHLDGQHQAFALGLWFDARLRVDAFKALYSACALGTETWDPIARPFSRILYDPGQLLLLSRVSADGRPVGGWRKLWEKVFEADDLPDRPENDLKNLEKEGLFDAGAMIQTVVLSSAKLRRNRGEAWLFGQRVFGDAPVAAMPNVLVALRGYGRFRVLADTLDRLGIRDPAVYSAAFRRATVITGIGDSDRAWTALALYQGGLALIERARLARTIDAGRAADLVLSLSRVEMSDAGEFVGGVAFWVDAQYLPAIGRAAGLPVAGDGSRSMEDDVLGALAGTRAGGAPRAERIVEHEGTRYRLDAAGQELLRLQAVRGKQAGLPLDAVMAFAREIQAVATGIRDLAQIPPRVAGLKAAAAPLLGERAPADGGGWNGRAELAERIADAVQELTKIRKAKDLSRCERIALPLRRSLDRYLARTLVSLAYACSLGDPDGTALLAGDPSPQHDFGVTETNSAVRARTPWIYPSEAHAATGRWYVLGSLLALDTGLAQLALRRISTDSPPGPPTISDNDRQALSAAVVLANAFDYRDGDMALIAGALRRGRERLASLASVPGALREVGAAAGLDELRIQAIAWSLAHDPDRAPSFFSLGELLRLGELPTGDLEALDAWGTSGMSFDGRLGLRFPASQPWATLCGRRGMGVVPTLVPDLGLLVAEALHEEKLPAALARSVLAVATADVVDRLGPAFDDDWMTIVSDIRRLVPPRMDDYLAAVITNGPMVPIPKGAEGGRIQ